jgi:hypothetical protein
MGGTKMTIYLGTKLYCSIVETLEQLFLLIDPSALAEVISEISPCAVTGHVTCDNIVGALSEFGDIEPESWRGDDIRDESISIDSFEGMTFSEMRQLVANIAIAKAKRPKLEIVPLAPMPLNQFFAELEGKVKSNEAVNVIQFPLTTRPL